MAEKTIFDIVKSDLAAKENIILEKDNCYQR